VGTEIGFGILNVVKMSMLVSWVGEARGIAGRYKLLEEHVSHEDIGSMFLLNVCTYLQVHIILLLRKPPLK
jgi:hypothetical protein